MVVGLDFSSSKSSSTYEVVPVVETSGLTGTNTIDLVFTHTISNTTPFFIFTFLVSSIVSVCFSPRRVNAKTMCSP